MHGDVIGLIALDLELRLILTGMNYVPLEFNPGSDYLDDPTADAAGFRIPTHMIANLEASFHRRTCLFERNGDAIFAHVNSSVNLIPREHEMSDGMANYAGSE